MSALGDRGGRGGQELHLDVLKGQDCQGNHAGPNLLSDPEVKNNNDKNSSSEGVIYVKPFIRTLSS